MEWMFGADTPVNTLLMYVFILSNVGIAAAYGYIGTQIIPRLPLRRSTLFFGRAFFLFCALTHVEHILHTFAPSLDPDFMTWHGQVIHVIQFFAAWAFGIGFGLDVQVLYRNKYLTTLVNPALEDEALMQGQHPDQDLL